MSITLTRGAISCLSNPSEAKPTPDLKPVLQIIDVRLVTTGGGDKERYRVSLSDGVFHQQGMLATQQNELVRSGALQNGSVVQLTDFVCNNIRQRTIIIIINLNVIASNHDLIGDPKQFPSIQSSLNQPATTVSDTRNSSEGSVAGSATVPAGPPVYPPQHQSSAGPQSYNGNSYNNNSGSAHTGPISNAGPPVYPSRHQPSAGPQSYNGNSYNNNSGSGQYNSTRPTFTNAPQQPPANNHMQPIRPMYGNRGPVAKNEAAPKIIPIAALNPYQGRWTIKSRVTLKGELRLYNNAKGDGKVFSFDLLDAHGGEIRVTCFNAIADQFYNRIEVGKVYIISKGSLKPAQKAFNHLKNDYEIILDAASTIDLCSDDDTSIPRQQFHFRNISDIEGMDNNSVLDVIGIVSSIEPTSSITRKNGGETIKRTLKIKDQSGRVVVFTLWGNFCNAEGQILQNMLDDGEFPALAIKSARVYEFNGKSIGTISSSQLLIEPDFPEALKLKEWFNSVGKDAPSVPLSRDFVAQTDTSKTISQIKDEKLGTSEKPDWITVNATIWHMKPDNFCYTACPKTVNDRKCSKKVVNDGDGKWRCEKCDQTFDECDYRYIIQLQIEDHTGMIWATAFQEAGEEIMKISAKDLYLMKYEDQDDDKFTEIVRNALFNEFCMKLKVKEETYGDTPTIKSTVVKAEKIKASTKTKRLLQDLEKTTKTENTSFVSQNVGFGPQVGSVGQYGGSGGGFNSGVASGGGNSGASGECFKYHQPGPWAKDCPAEASGNHSSNFGRGPQIGTMGQVDQYSGSGGGFNSGVASRVGNSGASGECFKCHQPGHWAKDCPAEATANTSLNFGSRAGQYGGSGGGFNNGVASRGGNSGVSGECYKCKQPGHWANNCPGL